MKLFVVIFCCMINGYTHASSMVQISQLDDINFGTFQGSLDLVGVDNFCLYRDDPGNLALTATGSGTNNAFTLTNGVNELIYSVQFTDELSMSSALVTGLPLIGIPNSNNSAPNCSGIGDNASIELRIVETHARQAPSGTYTGTLFLTISPE